MKREIQRMRRAICENGATATLCPPALGSASKNRLKGFQKVWRGEFHNKKKNGELYWEQTSISPIRDAQGASPALWQSKRTSRSESLSEAKFRESVLRFEELADYASNTSRIFSAKFLL
jgi:hypothetical protein